MNAFGDRLRQAREAKGWSQEKLGFELEVTKATVSKWELNKGEPRLKHLARLRHLFAPEQVTLDWLIDDAVSMKNIVRAWQGVMEDPTGWETSPRLVANADEMALLARFRRLPQRRRRALVELLDPAPDIDLPNGEAAHAG